MSRAMYLSGVLLGAFEGFRLSCFPVPSAVPYRYPLRRGALRTVLSRMSVLRMKLSEFQSLPAEEISHSQIQ